MSGPIATVCYIAVPALFYSFCLLIGYLIERLCDGAPLRNQPGQTLRLM